MILGQVNSQNEAVIDISIQDVAGKLTVERVVVDTGFSGHLTLQSKMIAALKLPFLTTKVFSLGDSSEATFEIYKGVVIWGGQRRDTKVLSSEAHPLLGMALLRGVRICVDVVDGGQVRILPLN